MRYINVIYIIILYSDINYYKLGKLLYTPNNNNIASDYLIHSASSNKIYRDQINSKQLIVLPTKKLQYAPARLYLITPFMVAHFWR